MNYLGLVGKFMTGSGLKNILVQSKVMLEGTVNKILSGKAYYQATNAHMRIHEGMISIRWYDFEDFCLNKECDDFLCGSFMGVFVLCLYAFARVCLFVPCGHLLGRADLLALVCGV